LHAHGHPFGEARQLLLDVFFEGSTLPPSHLLNLGIQVTRQGEGIGAATLKQMGVNAVDQNALAVGARTIAAAFNALLASLLVMSLR
jgi:hypothetical protein